jgi:hypothetical protein
MTCDVSLDRMTSVFSFPVHVHILAKNPIPPSLMQYGIYPQITDIIFFTLCWRVKLIQLQSIMINWTSLFVVGVCVFCFVFQTKFCLCVGVSIVC